MIMCHNGAHKTMTSHVFDVASSIALSCTWEIQEEEKARFETWKNRHRCVEDAGTHGNYQAPTTDAMIIPKQYLVTTPPLMAHFSGLNRDIPSSIQLVLNILSDLVLSP